MLGSLQRARDTLREEVTRLRLSQEKLEGRSSTLPSLRQKAEDLRAQAEAARGEITTLQAQLAPLEADAAQSDSEIGKLRERVAELRRHLDEARSETVREAQAAAEEEESVELLAERLARILRAEEALQEALRFQWELLEGLAAQMSLEPPWRCSLCSCSNEPSKESCSVCESHKDGRTDFGNNRAVEAYFEFRLHQEFLGRTPQPAPEQCLPALRIALGHKGERWIEAGEIEELHDNLRRLASNPSVAPVLQAEAAYILFTHGNAEGQRVGRAFLKAMGEQGNAVRQMCRRHCQQQVALHYHRLLQLKENDLRKYSDFLDKLKQAQDRLCDHAIVSA